MFKYSFIFVSAFVILTSCAQNTHELDPVPVPELDKNLRAISFSSIEAEVETATRADITLGRDFLVYGYKNVGGQQTVFDGYTVKYASSSAGSTDDNSADYYYVHGDQTLKYWDYSASEYHFWAVSALPTSNIYEFVDNNPSKLKINDLQLFGFSDDASIDPSTDVLFSELNVRCPVSSDVVTMRFRRPYAKVRIMFYLGEDHENDITLTNVTFGPDPAAVSPKVNTIYSRAALLVEYPYPLDACNGTAKEAVQVMAPETTQPSLTYNDVLLPQTGFGIGISSSTAIPATNGTEKNIYYYTLPMGNLNPSFIMSCISEGEQKTTVVPAQFMNWQPNYSYTYIFKFTETGPVFVDARVEEWGAGGSASDTWTNW